MSRGEELLRRQFEEGPLSPQEDRELRQLLDASPQLRDSYRRWVQLERELEGREVPFAQLERMWARGAPAPAPVVQPVSAQAESWKRPKRSVRHRRWLVGSGLGLVAAAAVALFAIDDNPSIGVRGSADSSGQRAWVTVYQGPDDGGAGLRPVETEALADRPFAFAYTNLEGSPHTHLAIVGRDAAGRIHWFYPAYTNPASSPQSVAIESGVVDVELSELVRVDAAPGDMELCGLFTRTPLDVRRLDLELEAGGGWPEDATLDCKSLRLLSRGAAP